MTQNPPPRRKELIIGPTHPGLKGRRMNKAGKCLERIETRRDEIEERGERREKGERREERRERSEQRGEGGGRREERGPGDETDEKVEKRKER